MKTAMSDISDKKLLDMIASGESDAWQEMILRYKTVVYSVVFHVLKNRTDAEDAFQNTFIRIRKSARNFQYGENAEKWIKTIAGREAISFLGKKTKRKTASLENESEVQPMQSQQSSKKKEVIDMIEGLVVDLPDEIRSIISLRFAADMTQDEISRETGISQRTVSRRIKNGLEMLRSRLATAGITNASALAPVFLSKALLRETAPKGIESKLMGMAETSSRMTSAAVPSAALKKVIVMGIAAVVVAGGVLLSLHLNENSVSTDTDQSVSGNETTSSGEPKALQPDNEVINFEDDFESGLKAEWKVVQFIQDKDIMTVSKIGQSPNITAEKTSLLGGKKALLMRKKPGQKECSAILFNRSIVSGECALLTFDYFGKKEFKFMSVVYLGKSEDIFRESKSRRELNAVNHCQIKIQSQKTIPPSFVVTTVTNKILCHKIRMYTEDVSIGFLMIKGEMFVDNIHLRISDKIE